MAEDFILYLPPRVLPGTSWLAIVFRCVAGTVRCGERSNRKSEYVAISIEGSTPTISF